MAVAGATVGLQGRRAARSPLVRNVEGKIIQVAKDEVGVVVAVTMNKISRVTVAAIERWARRK